MQPVHFDPSALRPRGQPVGDQQYDRALPEHAAAPQLVEGMQRGRDPRPAGPVLDRRRAARQRLVRIAGAQRAGDIGQPRAEQEYRDTLAGIGDGMQEMQEQPRYSLIEPEISSSATIGAGLSMRPSR